MTEDLPRHFPFSTFRTKQNVSKSKLGGEFARKGWNDFSTGFLKKASFQVGQMLFTKEGLIQKKPISDLKILKKQDFVKEYKIRKRKPSIEHKEVDYFTSEAIDFCNLIQKKSLQSENQKDLITDSLNMCQNSLFLELQNIQDSFQDRKLTHQPKLHVKSSFECNTNFISGLAAKKTEEQENVPKKNQVTACQFIFQENDFSHSVPVRKIKKTNIVSDLYPFIGKKDATVIDSSSKPITNSNLIHSYPRKNHQIRNDVYFLRDTRKLFLPDQNRNKNASFNLSAFLLDESSKNKGSSWLQSLQTSDAEVALEDAAGKKRIRNILPGGFAEQMLKLQRMEKSEEVIWDHNASMKKKTGKSLSLKLTSVSSSSDIVIANCLSFQTETSKCHIDKELGEVPAEFKQSERVVVLLKENIFNKLHLKIQSVFHLYPPWQALYLPQVSCSLILSAKFIDLNSIEDNLIQDKISYNHPRLLPMSSSSTITSYQASNCFDENFYHWKQPKSLCARIQRIWKVEGTNKNIFPFASITNYCRYSLLIQDQNGLFYELVLSSTHFLPQFWKEFILQAEGKCYEFQNLYSVNRLCLKKYPKLSRVLESLSLLQNDGKCLKQEIYHQLAFNDCSVTPKAISEKGFPSFCSVPLQLLSSLFEEMNTQRFTFIGKIIFQFQKTLYLCDDSIPKSVQLESLFPLPSEPSLVGSLVLIRDAQCLEGCLFLDNYSSFIQLSEDSQMDESLKQSCGKRFNQLTNVNLQNVIPFELENSTFVFITGEVVGVDENNAISWLQCNLCFSEKLVQDSNSVIYCENCFHIVPKPVLNVRMSVICQHSPHVRAEVKLLSSTIKRILQIKDDIHQPQCKIGDVLGKKIGPLFCYIKNSTIVGGVKQFHALEVETS
ncbi:uncharacterized protein LOC129979368 isoform X2 [Argiope bruennichi]|uniref:uncharacterized protein LOC129979368 isoform X2 n=1 Tax=Argiope bruennichi TaxID=94029 RepID=UPI002494B4B6|nr:uncharacterized protein LOC129979368 isoform X2 [Argiope bruennichi]